MLPSDLQRDLDRALAALQSSLGENLHSCLLYGSAVRGNVVPGVSDLNLLLVLRESTPDAHASIAEAISHNERIAPFVLGLAGIDRSIRAFALKFSSIRRNYRVLAGKDFLADLEVEPDLERFLVEQSLRNLRLRWVHAFVKFRGSKRYSSYVAHTTTALVVAISEVIRLDGRDVPRDYRERPPVVREHFGADASILGELLAFRENPRLLKPDEALGMHRRVFDLLNHVLHHVESHWPGPPTGR